MKKELYKFITATEDCGTLTLDYKCEDAEQAGRLVHDEDVSEWSDREIREVTMGLLGVDEEQRGLIRVVHA